MDWDKIMGAAVGGALGLMVTTKWMEIQNEQSLRFTIRQDIRDFEPDTVESLLNALKSSIYNFESMKKLELRDQAVMVREVLIEEAERRGIL